MYSTKLTAALTGASPSQLNYWRRGEDPLLIPEYGTSPQAGYSFEDVVALRMCVQLRKETSLQKVRRAVEYLRTHAPDTHLSAHSVKAAGRTIVLLTNDGDYVDLIERPGQPGITVVMQHVFGEYQTASGKLVPALDSPASGLAIDNEIRGGYPVIAGTRIPYDAIAGLAQDGLSAAEIRDWYPGTSEAAIQGALDLAGLVDGQSESA